MADNRKYVVVANRQSIGPAVRHIAEVFEDLLNEQAMRNFQNSYYEKYRKLDGDEFFYCKSTKEMRKTQIVLEDEHY